MPSVLNQAMVAEYRALQKGARDCIVVDCEGLSVADSGQLREQLRKEHLSIEVVRGSLARIAFREAGFDADKALFSGPSAIVWGDGAEGAVAAAKLILEYRKKSKAKIKKPVIKGGFFEGGRLNASRAEGLAKMPSRAEMQSQLVGLILSPGSRVAGCVKGPGSRIAGALKALIEKREGGS